MLILLINHLKVPSFSDLSSFTPKCLKQTLVSNSIDQKRQEAAKSDFLHFPTLSKVLACWFKADANHITSRRCSWSTVANPDRLMVGSDFAKIKSPLICRANSPTN